MLRRTIATLLISALILLCACSHNKRNPQDPLEGLNREFFGLNKTLDRAIIKPVAYVYLKYLPQPMQSGIGNFFDNLRELPNIANDVLQWKIAYATHDTSRFLINSTIGVFGLFDPAGSLGLDHRKEDFGQTLYHWGYENSTYLVLPLIGPTTLRDALGLGVDYAALSLWPWVHTDSKKYALIAVDYVDLRARLLRREPVMDVLAVDEYTFYRDAYLQHRRYQFAGDKVEEDNNDDVNPYLDSDDEEITAAEKNTKENSKTRNNATDKKTLQPIKAYPSNALRSTAEKNKENLASSQQADQADGDTPAKDITTIPVRLDEAKEAEITPLKDEASDITTTEKKL